MSYHDEIQMPEEKGTANKEVKAAVGRKYILPSG